VVPAGTVASVGGQTVPEGVIGKDGARKRSTETPLGTTRTFAGASPRSMQAAAVARLTGSTRSSARNARRTSHW
jgi:hypothetical protein